MKKLLTILTFLIVTLNCFSQNVQSNNSFIFQPTTNSTTSIWFKNGIGKIDSGWRVPIDNRIWTPTGSGWIRFNPTIGALQYYNADSLKWLLVGSGSGGLPPSLATLSPGFGLIGVTYDPYLTSQTWLVDTSKLLTINNFLTNYFDTSSSTTATFFNVVSINNTPPVSPLDSSYYLVGTAPTGIWITHENQVAQRLGTGWAYTTPEISQTLTDISTQTIYIWNGTAWIPQKFAILGQLNPQDVDLRVGSIPNKALNFYTDSTLRMGIAADGGISFPAFNDLSTDYTVQLVLKNNLLDTVHARDLILTTNGSSGAATLINNVLNIPQYSSGGGGGVQSVTGNITGLVNNTDPLNPIVNAWRFGIEDNLGLQDRNVDMQGFGLYTYNGKEWNFSADAGIKTSYIIGKVSSTLPIMELSVKDSAGDQTINQNIIYPDSTIQYIHNIAGKDIRVTTPTPANGFYYSPLTVNGNKADSTGNITISTGTAGISQLGSPTYGLTRTNDSTYIVDTAVIASQIRLHNDSLTLATAINLKVNISDTAAMLSHYLNNVGYGLSKSGQVVSADTLALSTRAWRQKGIDSVVSLIPSLTGYVNAIAGENYLSKSGSTITANPVNLANTNVTGVLPIANGGTNNGSLSVTNGNLLYTDGSKVVGLGVGTAKQHLLGGTTPHWADTATGGGSGITKAYVPLVVSSGGDSISQRYNVKAYGATGDSTQDATPHIQAAINACIAGGGGTVFFPNGFYWLSSPLVTSENGVNPNAQLYIPPILANDKARLTVNFEGESIPNMLPVLWVSDAPYPRTGVVIKSTITGSGTNPCVFGGVGSGGSFLYHFVYFKNIALYVPANAGGSGPTMTGIDGRNFASLSAENIVVSADTSLNRDTLPQNQVAGIVTTLVTGETVSTLRNIKVSGFRFGIAAGEHCYLDNVFPEGNYAGVLVLPNSHPVYGSKVTSQWNKFDVMFNNATHLGISAGTANMEISQLSIETYNVNTRWFNNVASVTDSAFTSKGHILGYNMVTNSGNLVGNYSWVNNSNIKDAPDSADFAQRNAKNTFNYTAGHNIQTINSVNAFQAALKFQQNGNDKWYIGTDFNVNGHTDFSVYNFFKGSAPVFIDSLSNVSIGKDANVGSTAPIYIPYSTGNVTVNNLLGIGVAPTAPLHIKANKVVSFGQLTLQSATENGTSAFVYETYYDASATRLAVIGLGKYGGSTDPYFYLTNEVSAGGIKVRNASADIFTITNSGKTFIGGSTTPTAVLHLAAGTATANTAPLKFTSGTNLTTAEAGAMEYNGTNLFFTPTGTIRKIIPTNVNGRSTAQTAAVGTVVTQTVGAADASYQVSANVLVTTSSAENFTVTVAYTDESNTARTLTLNFQTIAGVIGTTVAFANGAVPYEGIVTHIRCKAATTITIATAAGGTYTGCTYNVEGNIIQTN